ncbi:MAG: hypothetical protein ACM3N4_10485 [Nitrososphaerota archaeon]
MSQPTVSRASTAASGRASVAHQPGISGGPLHGRWLLVARVGWIVLTLMILAFNVVMLPRFVTLLRTPCPPGPRCFYLQLTPYDQRFLRQSGLSVGFLATYQAALFIAVIVVYCAIAAIIFWRRAADRMALFCAFMLVIFGGVGFTAILQDSLATAPPLWYGLMGILYVLGQSGFVIFFLLFPNGRFVPRWSRWLVPLIVAYWAYEVFFSNLIYEEQFSASTFLFFGVVLTPVAAQIYRYRRVSTHRERQQTKWVVFGFALAMVGLVLFITLANTMLPADVLQSSVLTTFVQQTLSSGFLLVVPISIAIAILRSRLYDIDVLINRTLVYGSLTAILALIYAGGVIGAQAVINGVAQRQSSESSPVLIVVTTLLIAALFQPLRRRLQRVIDRRFYRRKYNVEQTLSAFSATLRQEIDLRDLNEHLLNVVQQTMEPTTLSLWLRSPTAAPDRI